MHENDIVNHHKQAVQEPGPSGEQPKVCLLLFYDISSPTSIRAPRVVTVTGQGPGCGARIIRRKRRVKLALLCKQDLLVLHTDG